jgi:hypothetical protein
MDSCLWSFLEFYTWLNRIKLYFLWSFVKVEFVESGLELVETGLAQHTPVAFFPVAAQGTSLKRVKTGKRETALPGKRLVADLTQYRTCGEPRWIRIIRGGSRSRTQLYYFCEELHLFSDFLEILLVTKVPRVSVEGKTKKLNLRICLKSSSMISTMSAKKAYLDLWVHPEVWNANQSGQTPADVEHRAWNTRWKWVRALETYMKVNLSLSGTFHIFGLLSGTGRQWVDQRCTEKILRNQQ